MIVKWLGWNRSLIIWQMPIPTKHLKYVCLSGLVWSGLSVGLPVSVCLSVCLCLCLSVSFCNVCVRLQPMLCVCAMYVYLSELTYPPLFLGGVFWAKAPNCVRKPWVQESKGCRVTTRAPLFICKKALTETLRKPFPLSKELGGVWDV